ncbi:TPA: hypothetical protein ACTXXA_002075 [Legionella anisa]
MKKLFFRQKSSTKSQAKVLVLSSVGADTDLIRQILTTTDIPTDVFIIDAGNKHFLTNVDGNNSPRTLRVLSTLYNSVREAMQGIKTYNIKPERFLHSPYLILLKNPGYDHVSEEFFQCELFIEKIMFYDFDQNDLIQCETQPDENHSRCIII